MYVIEIPNHTVHIMKIETLFVKQFLTETLLSNFVNNQEIWH